MFWILLIGIIIVYCVLKEEDSSGSSSNKRSSTTTSKAQAAKTLNVPYPYSAIKRMEVPVYIWETGIKNKIPTELEKRKLDMLRDIICLYYIVVLVLKTEIILKCIGRMRCSMMLMEEWLMCSIKGAEELCQSMMSSVNIRRQ